MSGSDFAKGMGIGMAAGVATGVILTQKKRGRKTGVGRALKTVGDIVDHISDGFNM